ncbi:MAG: CRISPR-associated endonuclease Cas2 [Candidatus Paceibacterota bacterium]
MASRKRFYYKGMQVNAFGLPVFNSSRKEQNKKYSRKIRRRSLYHVSFSSYFKKDAPKNLIIMYDIPHTLKKERDWFRRHLIKFGYIMVQKSVWVGPLPLPKNFLNYLKEIKIGDNFKTFKLAKSYDSLISAMA